MKKIKNYKQPKIEMISVNEIDRGALFGALTDGKTKHVLRQENVGYVFRNVENLDLGHSGAHATIESAVSRAIEVRDTEVFQFDNYNELGAWLMGLS